jgi:acetate kinase
VKDAILVLNSGSSSLKFGVYRKGAGAGKGSQDEELVLEGSADGIARDSGSLRIKSADGKVLLEEDHVVESQPEALKKIARALAEQQDAAPVAVGHRIVHGGPKLRDHQLITPDVLRELKAAMHFAPLHIPPALALVKEAQKIFPDCPHFACFDDAFHRTMPEVARHLPLPTRYYDAGVVRYGFHGLSCESLVHQLGSELPRRAVFAHLGNGSSLTALVDGKSIDTSMGLTPTGGVPMGTRSGDLDPGVLVYILRTEKLSADKLELLLNHDCGLAGFSNGESDMQVLLQRAARGDGPAELAIAAFTTAVRKYIGAYAALMGGIDLLVFTGGIGENSEEIRRRSSAGLKFLVREVRVIKTEEDRQIARHTRALLAG